MTYGELIDKIRNRERFSFSRFGDGEFNAIAKKKGSNCDNHQYFDSLGDALQNVLKSSPDYHITLQSLAYRQRKELIDEYTEKYNLTWTEANILHRASGKGRIGELFDALNERDVLIVGPEHLKGLYPNHLDNPYFLTIPDKDCWLSYETTKEELSALITMKDWVVVFCASMMANVLIHDFHGRATLIDAGSVFDPYCGVKSRKYHYQLNV